MIASLNPVKRYDAHIAVMPNLLTADYLYPLFSFALRYIKQLASRNRKP
tara:strand:+ start:11811 stop:11957 length:147 start_codon:yes stop_codon:yes gene_type:complete